jgi:GDP-mannose 4,6 dehydratase
MQRISSESWRRFSPRKSIISRRKSHVQVSFETPEYTANADALGALRLLIEVDARYFRATEVEILHGDPSKAHQRLGWRHSTTFEELVRDMMNSDLKRSRKSVIGINNMSEAQPATFSLEGSTVWVAGHRGMVGSAIVRRLASEGCRISQLHVRSLTCGAIGTARMNDFAKRRSLAKLAEAKLSSPRQAIALRSLGRRYDMASCRISP